MKNIINRFIPKQLKFFLINIINNYFDGYSVKSYSQEGEDMILKRIFEFQKNGFYVDVGAHHPKRFSNTFHFYKKGWNGINIDAMPGSMKAFKKFRKRDINIEVPISSKKEVLTYYGFNEPALNGFSKELSESRNNLKNYKIVFTKNIETETLEKILDKYLPGDRAIDFLSIDVEGLDLEVLVSLNLNKYKPKVILIEVLGRSFANIHGNPINKILLNHNYEVFAKSVNTVIYKKKDL